MLKNILWIFVAISLETFTPLKHITKKRENVQLLFKQANIFYCDLAATVKKRYLRISNKFMEFKFSDWRIGRKIRKDVAEIQHYASLSTRRHWMNADLSEIKGRKKSVTIVCLFKLLERKLVVGNSSEIDLKLLPPPQIHPPTPLTGGLYLIIFLFLSLS